MISRHCRLRFLGGMPGAKLSRRMRGDGLQDAQHTCDGGQRRGDDEGCTRDLHLTPPWSDGRASAPTVNVPNAVGAV